MCGIWSLLDLTERSYQSPESTGDPNDADQTLLGLPPTSSAHGPWSPILSQAWAPSLCTSCALGLSVPCPISHMRPLDLHYSRVQSCLQPCLLLLLMELSGWGCGWILSPAPVTALLCSDASGLCLDQWGHYLGWDLPQLLAHSSLGSCPCCSLTTQDRTNFFCIPKLLRELYIILRKG